MIGVGGTVLCAVVLLLPIAALLFFWKRPWVVLVVSSVVLVFTFAYRHMLAQQTDSPWLRVTLGLGPDGPVGEPVVPGSSPLGEKPYHVCLSWEREGVSPSPAERDRSVEVRFQSDDGRSAFEERFVPETLPSVPEWLGPDWLGGRGLWCRRFVPESRGRIVFEVSGRSDTWEGLLLSIVPGSQGRLTGQLRLQRAWLVPMTFGAGAVILLYTLVSLVLARRRRRREETCEEHPARS